MSDNISNGQFFFDFDADVNNLSTVDDSISPVEAVPHDSPDAVRINEYDSLATQDANKDLSAGDDTEDDVSFDDYSFEPLLKGVQNGVISYVDFTAARPDKIYLANKADILTKPRPSWAVPFDEDELERRSFTPVICKDGTDYYTKLDRYTAVIDGAEKTFYGVTCKAKLDIMAASLNYYLKRAHERKVKETNDLNEKRLAENPGAEKIKCPRIIKTHARKRMPRSDYDEIRNFLSEHHLPAYNHEIFAMYNEVADDIKQKLVDMKYQKKDLGDSYSKGERTSYGSDGTTVPLLDKYGAMIKKQNGQGMTASDTKKLDDALSKAYTLLGDISPVAKQYGLTLSYADGVYQHARKAIGLFTPYYHAIGVSFDVKENLVYKPEYTAVHELTHFLDSRKGSDSSYFYASDISGSTENIIAETIRRNMNVATAAGGRRKPSDYLNRSTECLARAVEEYAAICYEHNAADFVNSPGYLPELQFMQIAKPLVEKLIFENSEYFKLSPYKKGRSLSDRDAAALNKSHAEKYTDRFSFYNRLWNDRPEFLRRTRWDGYSAWIDDRKVYIGRTENIHASNFDTSERFRSFYDFTADLPVEIHSSVRLIDGSTLDSRYSEQEILDSLSGEKPPILEVDSFMHVYTLGKDNAAATLEVKKNILLDERQKDSFPAATGEPKFDKPLDSSWNDLTPDLEEIPYSTLVNEACKPTVREFLEHCALESVLSGTPYSACGQLIFPDSKNGDIRIALNRETGGYFNERQLHWLDVEIKSIKESGLPPPSFHSADLDSYNSKRCILSRISSAERTLSQIRGIVGTCHDEYSSGIMKNTDLLRKAIKKITPENISSPANENLLSSISNGYFNGSLESGKCNLEDIHDKLSACTSCIPNFNLEPEPILNECSNSKGKDIIGRLHVFLQENVLPENLSASSVASSMRAFIDGLDAEQQMSLNDTLKKNGCSDPASTIRYCIELARPQDKDCSMIQSSECQLPELGR